MRYKLANGNVIATTKQPVLYKDFDRIEISDDYDGTALEDNRLYDGDVEFEVRFYNPSTHTIRKSFNASQAYRITLATDTLGNTGAGYTRKDPYLGHPYSEMILQNLSYGSVSSYYFYPPLAYSKASYSHTVNPLTDVTNWNIRDHLDIVDDYHGKYYTYKYQVQFRRACGTGGPRYNSGRNQSRKVLRQIDYTITYKVHN